VLLLLQVRAGLFIAQHGVMVGDLEAAVGQLAALYEETPADNVLVSATVQQHLYHYQQ
jgi:hypothetical protein